MQSYEEFSETQAKILERYVSNTAGDANVFVLHNLPEVIKGALFSRYSRSSLGLRTLLLKEFILNEETAFDSIVAQQTHSSESQMVAIKKAQNFYDRILDGYGDDSIGELGGAHLAIENVSMIAAKAIEDQRIGGSPLEKSTRYIYFDQKVKGEYLFCREPVLCTSGYKEIYVNTCNMLFETYSRLIPPMTALMEERSPIGSFPAGTTKQAYGASLRAKVLDCLRGLLPASTLTNMGVYGNGRFFEHLVQKLHSSGLKELEDIGKYSYDELVKTVPSFIRRAEVNHKHYKTFACFREAIQGQISHVAKKHRANVERSQKPGVRLIQSGSDIVTKVAGALLFGTSNAGLYEWQEYCRGLSEEDIASIFDAASNARENRRHKSPRGLEHAEFTFEIIADFGIYRDLHRHRLLTQERQLLSCDYGYAVPTEILGTPMEKEYRDAMEEAAEAYKTIAKELPEEAQYVVPMAYNIRWYMHANLRALQWICELRSSPAGHPHYRYVAQEIARQITDKYPAFGCFFKFVDREGYELGRLGQEQRTTDKQRK